MNRLSESVKFLLLAATVLITCALISIGFLMAESAKNYSNTFIKQMNEYNKEIRQSDITKYDGLKVSGSDVVNFIKKNLQNHLEEEQFSIIVTTNTKTTIHTNREYIKELNNFTSMFYIKPTAIFEGAVEINKNGVIISVTFVQKS